MYIFCVEGTNDANCPHEVIVISNGYDHQLILNKALLIEPVSLLSVTLLLYMALSVAKRFLLKSSPWQGQHNSKVGNNYPDNLEREISCHKQRKNEK